MYTDKKVSKWFTACRLEEVQHQEEKWSTSPGRVCQLFPHDVIVLRSIPQGNFLNAQGVWKELQLTYHLISASEECTWRRSVVCMSSVAKLLSGCSLYPAPESSLIKNLVVSLRKGLAKLYTALEKPINIRTGTVFIWLWELIAFQRTRQFSAIF